MKRLSDRCIRFLHLADLHFGMENHGRIDPASGIHSRLADFSTTLEHVLDQAFEMGVDAVLFAGDAYRTGRPTPTQERELARHIERIGRSEIPLVMIVGNHDLPAGQGQANSIDVFGTLNLPHVHVLDKPETLCIDTPSGPLQVIGLPYPTRQKIFTLAGLDPRSLTEDRIRQLCEEALGKFIAQQAESRNPEIPLVLLAHIGISEAKLSGTERSMHLAEEIKLMRSAVAPTGVDYCALGHIHRFQDLNPDSHPPIVYPGTLERIDFGEEKDKKGFVIVDVEPGRAAYQFFPIRSRSFVTIELDLTNRENPTQAIKEKIDQENIEGAVVRLSCTATDEQKGEIDLKTIESSLQVAGHVAAFNIHPPETPEPVRRSSLTESTSLEKALKTWFDQQELAPDLQADLLKRAQQLDSE